MKPDAKNASKEERILKGIGVSGGISIGPAFVIDQHGVPVPEYAVSAGNVKKETGRFHAAIAKTQKQLGLLKQKASSLPVGAAEEVVLLLEAYRGMLSGSRLVRGVEALIEKDHINAESAVQKQIASIIASFAAMGDVYLASRGDDVREVGDRLIRNLLEQTYNPFADAPEGCILIAEDITPADTALMNPDRVAGFAAVLGGAEGHAAIMARALGLPAILGATELINSISSDDLLIIDGGKGELVVHPRPETLTRYKQEAAKQGREWKKLKSSLRDVEAITLDDVKVDLQANLELPREIEAALDAGAEGVGLLRTEFLYMNRPDLPSEDEQTEIFLGLLKVMGDRPLTIRTLDIGGEKIASALGKSVGESINPALGLRAIRLGLREPKLLEVQLAAILRAAAYAKPKQVRLLIPMVSSVVQVRQVRHHLVSMDRRLRRRGVKMPDTLPPVGAMIEIPSAAVIADALAEDCDFFSIGSNDLTQYTLAVDRGDERVAHIYNPYHPAVLRLIHFTVEAAQKTHIPVSLCGEMAGDPRATGFLLGMGLREFSMAPSRLPFVKQQVRMLSVKQTRTLAKDVLRAGDEAEVAVLLGQTE